MNGKLILAQVLTVASAAVFAQELALWRGETATALLDDSVELGDCPRGLALRVGVLRGVKAAPEPSSLRRVEVLDRVDWRASDPSGVRIVEVSAPADATPGVYRCGRLEIRVVGRTLPPPAEWKYYLDLWQHPWAVARMADVRPFSPRHYAAMKPLWTLLAGAGQKTLTVTLLDEPWHHQCRDAYHSMIGRKKVKADGGGTGDGYAWKFDYSVFDEYVAFGRACGIGPGISCYTMCPWGNVGRYEKEGQGTVSVTVRPGTPEFKDFWGDFLVDFARHLKEKGWFADTFIAMDERSPEEVLAIAKFIRAKAPGLRISMAGNRKPSDFKGISIDSYAQILSADYLTEAFLAEAAERRAKGLVTTHYVCCWPGHPNTVLTSRAGEAFWCGAYPAMAGLDGFLRWAYNSWPADPMTDGSYGRWFAGDTYLVYPDGSPSLRFLDLRSGIVAAEKVRILRAQGLFAADLDALAKRFDLKAANADRCDFTKIRSDVLTLVNR